MFSPLKQFTYKSNSYGTILLLGFNDDIKFILLNNLRPTLAKQTFNHPPKIVGPTNTVITTQLQWALSVQLSLSCNNLNIKP